MSNSGWLSPDESSSSDEDQFGDGDVRKSMRLQSKKSDNTSNIHVTQHEPLRRSTRKVIVPRKLQDLRDEENRLREVIQLEKSKIVKNKETIKNQAKILQEAPPTEKLPVDEINSAVEEHDHTSETDADDIVENDNALARAIESEDDDIAQLVDDEEEKEFEVVKNAKNQKKGRHFCPNGFPFKRKPRQLKTHMNGVSFNTSIIGFKRNDRFSDDDIHVEAKIVKDDPSSVILLETIIPAVHSGIKDLIEEVQDAYRDSSGNIPKDMNYFLTVNSSNITDGINSRLWGMAVDADSVASEIDSLLVETVQSARSNLSLWRLDEIGEAPAEIFVGSDLRINLIVYGVPHMAHARKHNRHYTYAGKTLSKLTKRRNILHVILIRPTPKIKAMCLLCAIIIGKIINGALIMQMKEKIINGVSSINFVRYVIDKIKKRLNKDYKLANQLFDIVTLIQTNWPLLKDVNDGNEGPYDLSDVAEHMIDGGCDPNLILGEEAQENQHEENKKINENCMNKNEAKLLGSLYHCNVKYFLKNLKETHSLFMTKNKWKLQIVLISEASQNIREIFPGPYSDNCEHIFLLERSGRTHVDLISNPYKYFSQGEVNRALCFYCNKHTFKATTFHSCHVDPENLCPSCLRRKLSTDTFITLQNIGHFCNQSKEVAKVCEHCNVFYYSEKCLSLHRCTTKNRGKRMIECCNKYISVTRNCPKRNSLESISLHHHCDEIFCYKCVTPYIPNIGVPHYCKLPKVVTKPTTNRIAVVVFEQKNRPPSDCYYCKPVLDDKEIVLCSLHLDEDSIQTEDVAEFNVATLLIEGELKPVQWFDKEIAITRGTQKRCTNNGIINLKDPKISRLSHAVQSLIKRNVLTSLVCTNAVRKILSLEDTTVFASQSDLMVILLTLCKFEITPKIVVRNSKILILKTESLKFLDIESFVDKECMFSSYTGRHVFFPEILNRDSELDRHILPEFNYFLCSEDSRDIIEHKRKFYAEFTRLEITNWHLISNLLMFSKYKCKLMLSALENLNKVASTLASEIKPALSDEHKQLKITDKSINSLTSYLMDLLLLSAQNQNLNLYIVPEITPFSRRTSKGELQYVQLQETNRNLQNIVHQWNTPFGQPRVYGLYPDMICTNPDDEKGKRYIFWSGCFIHGHDFRVCRINKEGDIGYNKELLEVKGERDRNKMLKFQSQLDKHSTLLIVWECEWNQFKKTEPFQEFMTSSYIPRPIERLIPREANRGGFVEVFRYNYSQHELPNQKMHCFDINAAYMYEAMTQDFPVGKFLVLLRPKLHENVRYSSTQNCFVFRGEPVIDEKECSVFTEKKAFGLLQCQILPPTNCNFPNLSIKLKTGSKNSKGPSVAPLCNYCATHQLQDVCKHSDQLRSLTGTWTFEDLNRSIEIGYEILEMYEAYIYPEQAKLGQSFFEAIHYVKTKNAGFPSDIKTYKDKERYCNEINLETNFQLKVEDVICNPIASKNFKRHALAAIGKFGQQPNTQKSFITSDPKVLYKTIQDGSFISASHPTKNTIRITKLISHPTLAVKPYLIFSAYVSAYCRSKMNKAFFKVVGANGECWYSDCDSCFFTIKKGEPSPLLEGRTFGFWKSEFLNVTSFHCLGPKRYRISFEKNGKLYMEYKSAGITLNDFILSEYQLTAESYEELVRSFLNNIELSVDIPQKRRKQNINLLPLREAKQWKFRAFRNGIGSFSRRKVVEISEKNFLSRPFGYNDN